MTGLVSFRDVLAVPRDQWAELRVADRMRPLDRALVVDVDRALADVVADLARDPLHRALVRRPEGAMGLLSVTDAARVVDLLTNADATSPGARLAPREAVAPRPRARRSSRPERGDHPPRSPPAQPREAGIAACAG